MIYCVHEISETVGRNDNLVRLVNIMKDKKNRLPEKRLCCVC